MRFTGNPRQLPARFASPFRPIALCLLILIVLLLASSAAAAQQSTGTDPVFEPAPCRSVRLLDSAVECGYLNVPENRSNPDSPMIRLHVAVIKAASPNPKPDPVIFLDGGPGGPTLEYLHLIDIFDTINEERDIVFFDQRGVGYSEPSFGCEHIGVTNLMRISEDLEQVERNKLAYRDHESCRRLSIPGDVDLSAYNTAENAADVEDLRQALGYQTWNLYGASYGTLLALHILRDYPQHVRSAALLGVVPPQVNWIMERAINADRAFGVFFEMCAQDPLCASDYPTLESDFIKLVDQLNREPVIVRVEEGLMPQRVVVRGETYVGMLFSALYSTRAIAEMPRVIDRAVNGLHEDAGRFQLNSQFLYNGVSVGMHLAVVCSDTIVDTPYDVLNQADLAFPLQNGYFNPAHYRDLCQIWGVPAGDPITREPVHSEKPVLLLSGDFDPVTPPNYADLAAETLPKSYRFVLPNIGHFISQNPCAQDMIREFIDNPFQAPDSSCLDSVPTIAFLPSMR